MLCKSTHLFAHFIVIRGIDFAVIPHNGVAHEKGVLFHKCRYKMAYLFNLLGTCAVAR